MWIRLAVSGSLFTMTDWICEHWFMWALWYRDIKKIVGLMSKGFASRKEVREIKERRGNCDHSQESQSHLSGVWPAGVALGPFYLHPWCPSSAEYVPSARSRLRGFWMLGHNCPSFQQSRQWFWKLPLTPVFLSPFLNSPSLWAVYNGLSFLKCCSQSTHMCLVMATINITFPPCWSSG